MLAPGKTCSDSKSTSWRSSRWRVGKATEGGTVVGREKLIRHDHSQDPVLPEQGRAIFQEWNIEIEFAGCRFELLFELSDERIVQILNANVRGIADDAVEAVTRGRFPVRKNAGEFRCQWKAGVSTAAESGRLGSVFATLPINELPAAQMVVGKCERADRGMPRSRASVAFASSTASGSRSTPSMHRSRTPA